MSFTFDEKGQEDLNKFINSIKPENLYPDFFKKVPVSEIHKKEIWNIKRRSMQIIFGKFIVILN